jgi:uridine kinase
VVCVGIAGPTGSGKTALSDRIAAVLNASVLDMSQFVKIETVIDANYDDPTVMDFALCAVCVPDPHAVICMSS